MITCLPLDSVRRLSSVNICRQFARPFWPARLLTVPASKLLMNLCVSRQHWTPGLIVTELIVNCFEHAFPDGRGQISVSVATDQDGTSVTVKVRDNGIGFPATINNKRNGIGLVKRLAEQLNGTATVRSDSGTEWVLTIPTPIAPS
jgi:LytS/YehU family sensor histidine kinase